MAPGRIICLLLGLGWPGLLPGCKPKSRAICRRQIVVGCTAAGAPKGACEKAAQRLVRPPLGSLALCRKRSNDFWRRVGRALVLPRGPSPATGRPTAKRLVVDFYPADLHPDFNPAFTRRRDKR